MSAAEASESATEEAIWYGPLSREDRKFLGAVYEFVKKTRLIMELNLKGNDSPIEDLMSGLRAQKHSQLRTQGKADPELEQVIAKFEELTSGLGDCSTFGKLLADLAKRRESILENRSENMRLIEWVESYLSEVSTRDILKYRAQLSNEQKNRNHHLRLLQEVFRVRTAIRAESEAASAAESAESPTPPASAAAPAAAVTPAAPVSPQPPTLVSRPPAAPLPGLPPGVAIAPPRPPATVSAIPAASATAKPDGSIGSATASSAVSLEILLNEIASFLESRLLDAFALTEILGKLLKTRHMALKQLEKASQPARSQARSHLSELMNELRAARDRLAQDKAVCRRLMILTNFVQPIIDAVEVEPGTPAVKEVPARVAPPIVFGQRFRAVHR